MTASAYLSVGDLSYEIGGQSILDHISCEVPKGEWLTVVGPNGSGKTTFLRIIAGLLAPSRGTAMLDGLPVASRSRAELARIISYLPQVLPRAHGFSVNDVLDLSLTTSQSRTDLIERFGLKLLLDRQLSTLSGGELQRVFVASTMAQETALVLLDEFSAYLDPRTKLDVLESVEQTCVSRASTTVCVSHDLNLVLPSSSWVLVLNGGRSLGQFEPHDPKLIPALDEAFACHFTSFRDPHDDHTILVPRR